MSDIKVKTKKRTIKPITVKQLIDDYIYLIDLDADYQRETIWSRKKQEELLDSIIQGIDIPKFYLAEVKNDETFEYECIDGKQRMTTLLNFFKPDPNGDNSLKIKVAGEKYTYNQLKKEIPQLAEKIDEFELTFVIYPEIDDEELIRESLCDFLVDLDYTVGLSSSGEEGLHEIKFKSRARIRRPR